MDALQNLEIDSATWPALVFAIKRTIDDLELRARVDRHADPDKGLEAALGYREDVERLQRPAATARRVPHRPRP